MIKMIVFLLAAFFTTSAFAHHHSIVVSEPNFTAERIELNTVTKTYVIVKPKYYINGAQAVPILRKYDYESHLCSFFGFDYKRVISYVDVKKSSISKKYQVNNGNAALEFKENGTYGVNYDVGHRSSPDSLVIDFLECSPK